MKSFIILLCTVNVILMSNRGHCENIILQNSQKVKQTQPQSTSSEEKTVDDLIQSVFNIDQQVPKRENDRVDNIKLNKTFENLNTEKNAYDYNENCKCVPRNQCKNQYIKVAQCIDNYVLCCIELVTVAPLNLPMAPRECGIRNPEGIGFRISKDENEASFGEFPWMVAILYETIIESDHKFNIYQCGGSLIHPQVVLTAAHCVHDRSMYSSLKIRAGEWDTQTVNELYSHQDRKVEFIQIHENFTSGRLHNDIALLFLETPVTISENVNTVCLPPKNAKIDMSKKCIATGWGKNSFGQEGKFQVILKKIELPYVPRKQCTESLRKTRLGKMFSLHRSFICAGGEPGKDTCKGDGGSPLVCPIRDRINQYQQVGIVSWGIGCGENNTPGIYVNIPYMRDWIDRQMAANNFSQSAYEIKKN